MGFGRSLRVVGLLLVVGGCDPNVATEATLPLEERLELRRQALARADEGATLAGSLHNQGMRAILSALNREKRRTGKRPGRDVALSVATRGCRAFWARAGRQADQCGNIEAAVRSRGRYRPTGSGGTGDFDVINPSTELQDLGEALVDAVAASHSLSQYLGKVDSIVDVGAATLNTLEYYNLAVVASVADSSATYWAEEISDWYEVAPSCDDEAYEEHPACLEPPLDRVGFSASGTGFGLHFAGIGEPPVPAAQIPFFWLLLDGTIECQACVDIIGWDVAGAIAGSIAGLFSPPVAPLEVAGAAVGASAAGAFLELWGWLF